MALARPPSRTREQRKGALLDPGLIDQIYEAAVLPDRWPRVLATAAARAGAVIGSFLVQDESGVAPVVSGGDDRVVQDYFAQGWGNDTSRTDALMAEQYPGFRTETDYHAEAEIAAMPSHAQFLDPRGLIAGAATLIQGAHNDRMMLGFDGFPTYAAARAAVPMLDAFRPHFARAISLTGLHRQRTQLIVDSLALAGAGAAVVGADGRLCAANGCFTARIGPWMFDGPLGLRFADTFLQRQFALALARHCAQQGAVQSVAVRDPTGGPPFVVHLLPIKGAARELCEADGILLLVADGANAAVPDADLLRLLFDLTPAEARLTRLIADGHALAAATHQLGIKEATGRVHLKSIFAKTGVARQAELVRLLVGLSVPPKA